jgi:hypothetical protein
MRGNSSMNFNNAVSASFYQKDAKEVIPPLISTSVEMNPSNKEVEVAVYLEVEELEFWFSPKAKVMDQIVIWATWPADVAYWSEMEMQAMNQLADFHTRVNAKLEFMTNNHSNVLIEGKINAPVLIIYDTESKNNVPEKSNVLVVDLGLMKLHTEKLAKAKRQKDLEAMSVYSMTNASYQMQQHLHQKHSESMTDSPRLDEAVTEENNNANINAESEDLELLNEGVPLQNEMPLNDQLNEKMEGSLMRRSSIFHKYGSNKPDQTYLSPSKFEQTMNRIPATPFTGNQPDFDITEEELFDVFQMKITSIEVYLIECMITNEPETGKWSVSYEQNEKHVIVPSFEIDIEIQVSVLPWDITLPPVKLFIDIPSLQVQLSEQKIMRLIQFAQELVVENSAAIESNIKTYHKMNDLLRRKNQKQQQELLQLQQQKKRNGGLSSSFRATNEESIVDRRSFSRRSRRSRGLSMGAESVSSKRRGGSDADLNNFFDANSNFGGEQHSEKMTNYSESNRTSRRVSSRRSNRSKRYSKSSAVTDYSEDLSRFEEAKERLRKLDEEGIQIKSDDEDEGANDRKGGKDEDDSFFSMDDEQDNVEANEKAIEDLKYVIAQRESIRARLLTDIRLIENDITKGTLLDSLKNELNSCDIYLHQLKIAYVELLMNENDYLKAFDTELTAEDDHSIANSSLVSSRRQLKKREHMKEKLEDLLSPSLEPQEEDYPDHIGHKRTLLHASVLKLTDFHQPKFECFLRENLAEIHQLWYNSVPKSHNDLLTSK